MKLLAYPTVLTVRFKETIGIYLGNKCFSSHFSQNFQVKTTGKGEALIFLYCVFKCVIHAILFYQNFFFHLLVQIVLHLYIMYFIYLLYMIKKAWCIHEISSYRNIWFLSTVLLSMTILKRKKKNEIRKEENQDPFHWIHPRKECVKIRVINW